MQRQEIEIDGKVYEECSHAEFHDDATKQYMVLTIGDVRPNREDGTSRTCHFRLKKAEPRVWEGKVVEFCTGNRVVYVGKDWPGGTPVIVTEKQT